MNLDAILGHDFGPIFQGIATPVSPSEQRAAMERAKHPGSGHLRQYGERPVASDSQRIVPFHARQGVRG